MKTLVGIPRRNSSVSRWSGVPIVGHRRNGSEHGYEVSFLATVLYKALDLAKYEIDLGELLQFCIIHDIPEIVTADLPAGVKQKYPEIKAILTRIENDYYTNELALINIEPSKEIKFVCKVADYICVRIELEEELRLNNTHEQIIEAINVVEIIHNNTFSKNFTDINQELVKATSDYLFKELGWTSRLKS